ncbi:hypothetical protein ACFV1L_10530 [Kitasatospora sp. NPDC059646]|uniref:hypothetical protein n=1 Tax=Kitasatospora sp. NPDC059646 TaxID=3346893 RepID=UPI0036B4B8E2
MDRDHVIELTTQTLDVYYDTLADPADVDTDDLAEAIVGVLERAGLLVAADAARAVQEG